MPSPCGTHNFSEMFYDFYAKEDEIFFANRLKRVRAMITLKTTTATDVPMPKAYLKELTAQRP